MQFESFRLVVIAHRDYDGEYICRTHGELALLDTHLSTKDPKEARQRALAHVKRTLAALVSEAKVKVQEPLPTERVWTKEKL